MYVISIGVGFLASFLFARGKTREFAVKRSLGMSRARVVGSVFLEQLLVGTFGCLLGIMVGVLIQGLKIGTVWGGILFAICYRSGALTATLWITNVSVMILLKAEE
jgi:ABC-type antimicrobial peptide transport system permease subunit